MKDTIKLVSFSFLALIVIYVLGFFATGGSLSIYKFWAPKLQEARREVFEQTQSYVHGKNTYISRLRLQYESTAEEQKEALRRLILSEASTIDPQNLTAENLNFVKSLERK